MHCKLLVCRQRSHKYVKKHWRVYFAFCKFGREEIKLCVYEIICEFPFGTSVSALKTLSVAVFYHPNSTWLTPLSFQRNIFANTKQASGLPAHGPTCTQYWQLCGIGNCSLTHKAQGGPRLRHTLIEQFLSHIPPGDQWILFHSGERKKHFIPILQILSWGIDDEQTSK